MDGQVGVISVAACNAFQAPLRGCSHLFKLNTSSGLALKAMSRALWLCPDVATRPPMVPRLPSVLKSLADRLYDTNLTQLAGLVAIAT